MNSEHIKSLQKILDLNGFDPGPADGIAGPRTMAALDSAIEQLTEFREQLSEPDPLSFGDLSKAAIRMFPYTPEKNIRENLPFVMKGLDKFGLLDKGMFLMALATIRAETESFQPVAEGISRYNTDPNKHPFNRYDDRSDLGNHGQPDGYDYRGRGYIQLTGRDNYLRYGQMIGRPDLVDKPDLACDPAVAGELLAAFLKRHDVQIRSALAAGDLAKARRKVNGGRHGLDRFVDAYQRGAQALNS